MPYSRPHCFTSSGAGSFSEGGPAWIQATREPTTSSDRGVFILGKLTWAVTQGEKQKQTCDWKTGEPWEDDSSCTSLCLFSRNATFRCQVNNHDTSWRVNYWFMNVRFAWRQRLGLAAKLLNEIVRERDSRCCLDWNRAERRGASRVALSSNDA